MGTRLPLERKTRGAQPICCIPAQQNKTKTHTKTNQHHKNSLAGGVGEKQEHPARCTGLPLRAAVWSQ